MIKPYSYGFLLIPTYLMLLNLLFGVCGYSFGIIKQSKFELVSDPSKQLNDTEVHLIDFTRENLNDKKIYPWFTKGYNSYHPDMKKVDSIHEISAKIKVIVFGGSWCGDTKDLLPNFYKVADMSGIPSGNITLIGVDKKKDSKDGRTLSYKIINVPTFIIYSDDIEQGRIVESVNKSIEEDILHIYKSKNTEFKK